MNRKDIIEESIECGYNTMMNGGNVRETVLMTFDDYDHPYNDKDYFEVLSGIDKYHEGVRRDAGVTNPINSHERRHIEKSFENNP